MSVELRDRIVLRHNPGEGKQKMSAALKVPKNTMASIILKWNKFVTTKTLPRAGCPAKLSTGHSDRAPEFLCGDGRTFQKDNYFCSPPPIRPFGRVARRKPLLSKRHMTACLAHKDSQTMRVSGLMKPRLNSLAWMPSVTAGGIPQIQVCQACIIIPKKTRGCNPCQRFFNKVLSKGSEYLRKCDTSVLYF